MYEEAAVAYTAAFAQMKWSRLLCDASESYELANKLDQALATARRCLELSSKYDRTDEILQAHKILSSVLKTRGVYEESANHARQAIAIAVDDPWSHYFLANALRKLRRSTEAVSSAKTAIRLSDGK
jgi:tetratricopeptide (TPR) repeat protein